MSQSRFRIIFVSRTSVLMFALFICNGCALQREREGSNQLVAPLNSLGSVSSARSQRRTERELCIETANTLASKGHAREAIQLYEKAESLAPSADPLDLELAPLYSQTGNNDGAVARYKNAISSGKSSEEVINNFAWTLTESEKFEEASKVIQQGLEQSPESERLKSLQAVLLYRQGQRAQALRAFANLYGDSAAHHNIAVLDIQHGDLDLALENANRATSDSECDTKSTELRDALFAAKIPPSK
jgi:Tfp pilus assembly protein PilF